MPNRFQTALASGLATAQAYAGESIIYRRGTAAVGLVGMRGDKSATETQVGGESTVQTTRVDWLFTRETILRDAGAIVPALGDRIVDAAGVVYLVTKHPNDGKLSRWSEHRLQLRIHTLVQTGEK